MYSKTSTLGVNKKILTILVIILSIFIFSSCNENIKKTEIIKSKKLKDLDFIIDWQAEPTYLGIYYALDTKEFEKIGYNMKIKTSWGAHQAIAAISSGKYKIGTAAGGATVLARSNGNPIKSLGVLYKDIPSVIYGLTTGKIAKKPKDIEGMKIGIYPGSITNNEFEAFIKKNNLDKNKITIVPISGADIPLLKAGKVDAIINYTELSPAVIETNDNFEKVNGKKVWRLALKNYGVKSYGLNIITNESSFSTDKQDLEKIKQAVHNGYTNACKNKKDAVEKFIKRFPDKNKKYVLHSLNIVCEQLNNPIGEQTKKGWQETINLFNELKLLKNKVKVEDIIGNY